VALIALIKATDYFDQGETEKLFGLLILGANAPGAKFHLL
jgi:hypothetical protein